MTDKNLFDFLDLSDLPEELAGKLSSDTDAAVKQWAGIIDKAAAAGISDLSINQIIAVAHRLGFDMPTQQTVRNYLNAAVKHGLISKPTRMSYGPAGTAAAVVSENEDEGDNTDPLADVLA